MRCVKPLMLACTLFAGTTSAQTRVYSHDFEDIGGWPDSDANGDLNAIYTVVGGEYLINPLQNMHYALAAAPASSPSPDMQVVADVRLSASNADSRAGLACRVGTGLNFYAFNLVASGGFEIVRVRDGEGERLSSGSITFDPAEGARLSASCRGSELVFSANGEELARVNDSGLAPATGAGLLSVSPVIAATNAAFDNFSLSGAAGNPGGNVTATLQSSPPDTGMSGGGQRADGALPLIEDMALHADSGAGEPGDRKSLFDVGRQRVYLVLDLSRPAAVHYRAEWKAIRGSEESTVMEGAFDSNGHDRRVWLYADRDWSAGLYRVDLYANGQLLDQREFSVY